MDIKDIQNLIKFISKTEVSEVSYKDKDFKIKVKTQNGNITSFVQPVMQQTHYQPVTNSVQEIPSQESSQTNQTSPVAEDSKYVTIKSPMIGTFYRRPSPDKENFVNVGDSISAGSVVCIIEAMKLFNEIESEISGTIVKILIDESSPVEYDQPLFLVDPS